MSNFSSTIQNQIPFPNLLIKFCLVLSVLKADLNENGIVEGLVPGNRPPIDASQAVVDSSWPGRFEFAAPVCSAQTVNLKCFAPCTMLFRVLRRQGVIL